MVVVREPGDQVAEHARGGGEAVRQGHDGLAVLPGLAVEDVDAADGGDAVVEMPVAVGGFHFVRSSDDFYVWDMGARRHGAYAAAGPACDGGVSSGSTGNLTPVSSSETVQRRRWMAVSWDCLLDSASFGKPLAPKSP